MIPTQVKDRKKLQPKTQHQSATRISPPGSSTLSSAAVLKPMPGLRNQLTKKSGSTNTSRITSLVKLSQGVRLRPSEPFIASPKQPQSVTQVTSRNSFTPFTT